MTFQRDACLRSRFETFDMLTIDNNRKRMPYRVPEDYFRRLEARLEDIPHRGVKVSMVEKLKPYLALAAAFLIIVTGGTALLRLTAGYGSGGDLSAMEELTLADLVPVTDPELIYRTSGYFDDASGDGLAAYLIDSGTTLDYIEYYETEHEDNK